MEHVETSGTVPTARAGAIRRDPAHSDSHGEAGFLTPLTSIRFFAAMHILLFHLVAMLAMASPGRDPTASAALPDWQQALFRFFGLGYCSTSLFFLLSGFILTYLYVGPDGRQTVSNRSFQVARLSRIYPLHLVAMLVVAPGAYLLLKDPVMAAFMKPSFFGMPLSAEAFLVISGVFCATLTQAWIPDMALSWNFTTWALSVVVFFYLVFPLLVKGIARLNRAGMWVLLALAPVVSLIPSMILLAFSGPAPTTPEDWGQQQVPRFWSELVMRNPLLWLPHFLMGMMLARLFNITRHDGAWKTGPGRWPVALGDVTALVCLTLFFLPDEQIARLLFLGGRSPHPVLRHGLLAPLYLVTIHDLAVGRGLLARLLSGRVLRRLGEASFSVFILQGPMMWLSMMVFRTPRDHFLLWTASVTLATVAVSLVSVRYFEKPVARWLRRKLDRPVPLVGIIGSSPVGVPHLPAGTCVTDGRLSSG
jgi:peptidoglycan/LPS O-acetylase OafA/YrhL